MNTLKIKEVTTEDILELQKISRQTFVEAFADTNSEDNMQQYLEKSFALDKLTQEVAHPESNFYFAMLDNDIIGYLKLNTGQAQTELKQTNSLEIERIYVLQAFYGQKVGQFLFHHAVSIAEEAGMHSIWLGVWEHNERALRFYQKNGFLAFDSHVFYLGADAQTDLMMRKTLINA